MQVSRAEPLGDCGVDRSAGCMKMAGDYREF